MSFKGGFTLGGVKKPVKLGFGLPSRAKPKVPIAFAADSDDEDGGGNSAGLCKLVSLLEMAPPTPALHREWPASGCASDMSKGRRLPRLTPSMSLLPFQSRQSRPRTQRCKRWQTS